MQPGRAIGIDIGGTKIAAGLVEFPEGAVTRQRTVATRREHCRQDLECLLAELAPGEKTAIGIGICELVGHDQELLTRGTIPWDWAETKNALSRFGEVFLESDVRAAALAEARFGAGRNARNFLYVTIGTGISSCLVIDGQPFTGARGATGTLASGPLPVAQQPLEQIASGPALAARFGVKRAEDLLASSDPRARAIAEQGATALGATVGWLVNVLDPELVILGGGLGLVEGFFRDTLIAAARRHCWWPGHHGVPFVPAETGGKAGLIGAATFALENLRRPDN